MTTVDQLQSLCLVDLVEFFIFVYLFN